MFSCPICGYDQLSRRPTNHLICPSCGTEFGYDDFAATNEELRAKWLAGGAKWWSPNSLPPTGWTGEAQVERARELGLPGFPPVEMEHGISAGSKR